MTRIGVFIDVSNDGGVGSNDLPLLTSTAQPSGNVFFTRSAFSSLMFACFSECDDTPAGELVPPTSESSFFVFFFFSGRTPIFRNALASFKVVKT